MSWPISWCRRRPAATLKPKSSSSSATEPDPPQNLVLNQVKRALTWALAVPRQTHENELGAVMAPAPPRLISATIPILTAVSNVSFGVQLGDPLVRQPDHGTDVAIRHSFCS